MHKKDQRKFTAAFQVKVALEAIKGRVKTRWCRAVISRGSSKFKSRSVV